MDKFRKKVEQFSNLCGQVSIPLPEIVESHVVGSEYTEPNLVRMTAEANVEHLFGHYLCEYHAIEPDVVADIIKNLLYGAEKGYLNRGFRPNPVSKIATARLDRGYDESNNYHPEDDGFDSIV